MNTEHDTTTRIDGSQAPDTLIGRINSEEYVGANLSLETKRDYARITLILERKIKEEHGADTKITPLAMATQLQQLVSQSKIAQSTARAYKAATLFWLAENAQAVLASGKEGLGEYEKAYNDVRNLATTSLPKRTSRTSSPKMKSLPKQALEALSNYGATTPRAKNIGPLLAFLNANILVGLRPVEWFDSNFFTYFYENQKDRPCLALRIRNAKATKGRGNGPYRDILLKDITPNELATLIHFMQLIQQHTDMNPGLNQTQLSKTFFDPLGQSMREAFKKIGYHVRGATPTLYSSRHQAVANAKQTGLNEREIAAMFGHASVATAKSHYGRKLSAQGETKFRPSIESVNRVNLPSLQQIMATPEQQTIKEAQRWINDLGKM